MINILRPHFRHVGVVLVVLALAALAVACTGPVTPAPSAGATPAASTAGATAATTRTTAAVTATTEAPAATEATTATAQATAAATEAPAAGAAATVTATEAVTATGEVTKTGEVTGTGAVTNSGAETGSAAAVVAPVIIDPNDKATGDVNGIPVGFTSQGYPFRGDPKAPVTMIEYSDFQCPFCARYFVQTEPALNESYIKSGKLRVIFRDFPIAELHPNAPAAHQASLCVAEQGADKYWQMHNKLFQTQAEWSNATDPLPALEKLATEVGVDVKAYQACIAKTADLMKRINSSIAEGQQAGVQGTPSFAFQDKNGKQFLLVGAQPYDQFALYIDALAQGKEPPAPTPEATPSAKIPFWATAEGWKPDPKRPGFNMAGDEYRGNLDAKVTVIEFSDFQCPFCRQHAEETQPTLDQKFVDTGKILWVYKHFPLNIHPQAPAAGAAAECAADQGKFWEYSKALFDNQDKWSIQDPKPEFDAIAKQVGLDLTKFDECLAGKDAAARVQSDSNDGAPYVQGTPTFIVLSNGQGQIIPGALPVDRFVSVLQGIVDQAK